MKQVTLENIKGRALPDQWAKRLGVHPDELVDVTIEPVAPQKVSKNLIARPLKKLLRKSQDCPFLTTAPPMKFLAMTKMVCQHDR